MAENFRNKIEKHQIKLIQGKHIFGDAKGNRYLQRGRKNYPHILEEPYEENNLFESIRDSVKDYFKKNKISFWGGKNITPNTLSSQVSCLNHLFFIRDKEDIVRDVMQKFVGDKIQIKEMIRVKSNAEIYNQQYIAFEMVSDEDRLNEGKPTRGNTCTSIDAFAIALDNNNKKYILVIEWKLVENDAGNKAPTDKTSSNKEEIRRGQCRIRNYAGLLTESESIDTSNIQTDGDFYNSDYFILPFYELMRQTIWAENNKSDFNADDYIHINIIPDGNPMRSKKYKGIKGIKDGWCNLLTEKGKERYVLADPRDIVDIMYEKHRDRCEELANYLYERYYHL